MALTFFSLLFLASAPFTFSLPFDEHHDVKRGPLPSDWYQGDSHPVAKLFRRQNTTLPTVGSAGMHLPHHPRTLLVTFLSLQHGLLSILPTNPKQTFLQNG